MKKCVLTIVGTKRVKLKKLGMDVMLNVIVKVVIMIKGTVQYR